jgi:hypothetical protein
VAGEDEIVAMGDKPPSIAHAESAR